MERQKITGTAMAVLTGYITDAKWLRMSNEKKTPYVCGYCGGVKFTAVSVVANAVMNTTKNKMFVISGPLKYDKEGMVVRAGAVDTCDAPGILRVVSDEEIDTPATRPRVSVENETIRNFLASNNA